MNKEQGYSVQADGIDIPIDISMDVSHLENRTLTLGLRAEDL